jgi:hypothetical protein
MAIKTIPLHPAQGTWKGLNSDDPANFAPGYLSAAWNVYHSGPELLRRDGQLSAFWISAGATIVAGCYAEFSTGAKIIVQTGDGRFWQASGNMTSGTAMGTSGFGSPATFTMIGDVVVIATARGTMLGASGTDGIFALSGAPSAEFVTSYKNRAFAAGHAASADEVKYNAVGATTGLPSPNDWYSTNNAGNRIFSQGEGAKLIGVFANRDEWYAFKPGRSYRVQGNTPPTFVTIVDDREQGLYHRSLANVGRGLVGANEDGLYSIVDGKVEPLLNGFMLDYWKTLNLSAVSGFCGAWVPNLDQYRLSVVKGGGTARELLVGVFEVGQGVAWYRWGVETQAIWPVRMSGAQWVFYRGGSADGRVWRMDSGTLDGSATFAASAETGLVDSGDGYLDKSYRDAWVFTRTRGAQVVSATLTVQGENGRTSSFTAAAFRQISLATAVGDVKRQTMHLDGATGWGISLRIDFPNASAASFHQAFVEFSSDRIGTAKPS